MLREEDGRRRYARSVRGLLKIGMVGAFVVLFGVAAKALSDWRAGDEQHEAVRVLVELPPPEQGGEIVPIRAYVGLYEGRPRPIESGAIVVDDDEITELQSGDPRFTLRADEMDGSRFFVHSFVQMADYNLYCQDVELPRLRVREIDGEATWVNANTGRPLAELRLAPRERCAS